MAVYKKTYVAYDGPTTPLWSRSLIISRHHFRDMRRSRFFTPFFLGTLVMPVICALLIYLHQNLSALGIMGLSAEQIVAIDARFFLFFLGFQSMLALFLTAFIGPGLVSPDLANNALALYLSRPFSRAEYVVGKMSVLVQLISAMTWIPGLVLFSLQAYLAGGDWFAANTRVAAGLLFGSWVWILMLSLLSLALSAWVKWKPVAGGLLFVVFFAGSAAGTVINAVLDIRWGHLVNLSYLIGTVWVWLFQNPEERGAGAAFFRIESGQEIPIWCALAALAGFCLVCFWLLHSKVRGMEVVR